MSILRAYRAALDPAELFRQAFWIDPLPWQRDYLREDADLCVLKGRQVGCSTAGACKAIAVARYRDGADVVIVSPSLEQSKEVLSKARTGLRNLGLRLLKDSSRTLQLANGSRIVSLPGSPRSVRGYSCSLLIVDEAAFVDEATFVAATALVATGGGQVIYQSTPGDESGTFYATATAIDEDWRRIVVRSDEVSTISPEWLEAQRRQMAPDEFDREFMAVFGKGGGQLFTMARIRALFPEDDIA